MGDAAGAGERRKASRRAFSSSPAEKAGVGGAVQQPAIRAPSRGTEAPSGRIDSLTRGVESTLACNWDGRWARAAIRGGTQSRTRSCIGFFCALHLPPSSLPPSPSPVLSLSLSTRPVAVESQLRNPRGAPVTAALPTEQQHQKLRAFDEREQEHTKGLFCFAPTRSPHRSARRDPPPPHEQLPSPPATRTALPPSQISIGSPANRQPPRGASNQKKTQRASRPSLSLAPPHPE